MDPEDWDWKLMDDTLEQIQTLLPSAPENFFWILPFALAKRVVLQVVPLKKKSDYFDQQHAPIDKVSFAPILYQIQQMTY